ncbi:hypothetical protein [Methylobacterium sp. CM6246]
MPLSDVQKAALNRLQSFYEGDNPYNSVTNPGGFRQNGHLYNFVPTLKDIATVITGVAALAVEVATNSAQSPKAVRVDTDQAYTDAEKAKGQANLGLAAVLTSFVAKAGGTMTGALNIAMNYAQINFTQIGGTYDKHAWAVLINGADGKLYFQKLKAGAYFANPFYFGEDGSIYSVQMGDLNARIEARAAAFATQRVAKTGDTMTGSLIVQGDLRSEKSYPSIQLKLPDGTTRGWQFVDGSKALQWVDYATGTAYLVIDNAGAVSTAQLGDLNARIEARAKAFADIAQAAAAGESVSLAGDTMSGTLTNTAPIVLNGAASWLDLVVGNVYRHRFVIRSPDGALLLRNGDTGGDNFGFGTDGALWTKQFGDLNARIEARGLAYQNVAIAASVSKTSAARQDMSGDLLVSKSYPTLGMNYPNVFYSGWQVRENGYSYLMNMSSGAGIIWIGSGGDIVTAQIGDLNNRIENRASAFAENARVAAYNAVVISARYVHVGDYDITGNYNGGMVEPYGGAVCTGRSSITSGDGNDIILRAMRFRQHQIYIPNSGGWVQVGFA